MKATPFEQWQWETRSVEDGIKRYHRQKESRPAETPPAFEFFRRHLEPLTQAISVAQSKFNDGAGRPSYRKDVFRSLSAEKLAFITLSTALTVVCTRGRDATPRRVAKQIGQLCRLEQHYQEHKFYKTTPNWELRRVRKSPRLTPDDKLIFTRNDVEDVNIGTWLISLLLKETVGFARDDLPGPPNEPFKRRRILILTEDTERWFGQAHEEVEGLMPVHLPMLVPPVDWQGLSGGGYLYNREQREIHLVKRLNRSARRTLGRAELSQVYRAVNALQRTAWEVNDETYAVMREAWRRRLDVGNLPLGEPPERPESIPPDADDKAEHTQKVKWARWFRKKEGLVSAATVLKMRLKYCRVLKKYSALYFPHQLDRRGRAYPIPQVFDPQDDDAGRALIRFARGKPLTDRGREWLAIHLATLYGKPVDKKSFRERIAWADEHRSEIRRSAETPFKEHFWCEAENPWQFLAACKEWTNPPKERRRFVSHLPILVDGTCNGMQHLSALSRDPQGAYATNLVPNTTPQDIYDDVAEILHVRVEDDARAGVPWAADWLPKMERKLVKRATLATPYGITDGGIRRALYREDFTLDFNDETAAASYLIPRLKQAIKEVAPGSQLVLKWLRQIAETLMEHDVPVVWTTPAGFPVVHEYRQHELHPVRAGGFLVRVPIEPKEEFPRRPWRNKQRTAIGANFVHSLDAAHLMLTVNRLVDEDAERFQDFAAVHDSYGVHACDVDELNRILREEFVKMHTRSLLEEFVEHQRARTRLDLRDPPEPQGGFDLGAIMRSEYFFS